MTTTTTNSAPGGLLAWASGFWSALINLRAASLDQTGRVAEIERLQALSDDDLAARGLRREDIVHHVFRDLYYI